MKTYAIGVVAAVFATLVIGAAVIFWLSGQVGTLSGDIRQLEERREKVHADYQKLLTEFQSKSAELTKVSDELGHIEMLIGLEPTPEIDIHSRLDAASQTALEKMIMLQSIPNGFPVERRGVTSPYGWRTHPVRGDRRFHAGIDLRASTGTPVYATADGVVEWAAYHQNSGLGNLIILQHNLGFNTYYGHLDSIKVKTGEFVKKGDLIGHSGATGMVSGPHLHYEVRHIHRRLDPKPFLEWSLDNYETLFEKENQVQWDSLAQAVKRKANMPGQRLSLLEPVSTAN
ncbi:M23 family metallopeptidase [Alkalilimnicola ehrlichii]|uniref:M23 family metallopeptidase n=1 Tax=Alkalilimnicola ehrlichii TaxID=351052 RepID=UPI0021633F07|nr:M23 family metallopeptidase [Alkalilimnicola ehrlichii]